MRVKIEMIKKAFTIFVKAFEVEEYELKFLDDGKYLSPDGREVRYFGNTDTIEKVIEIVVGVTREPWQYVGTVFHEVLHAALDAAGVSPWWHHLIIDPLQEAFEQLLQNGEWAIPDSLADAEDEDLIIRGLRRFGLDNLIETYLNTRAEI